jgi:hypothetical protein
MREDLVLMPAQDDEKNGSFAIQEQTFKDDIFVHMLGFIPSSPLYPTGIENIEAGAKKEYNNNLPDFMETFLVRMKQSAETHRQQNCDELRKLCGNLRETILLELGEAVVEEFISRSRFE